MSYPNIAPILPYLGTLFTPIHFRLAFPQRFRGPPRQQQAGQHNAPRCHHVFTSISAAEPLREALRATRYPHHTPRRAPRVINNRYRLHLRGGQKRRKPAQHIFVQTGTDCSAEKGDSFIAALQPLACPKPLLFRICRRHCIASAAVCRSSRGHGTGAGAQPAGGGR